MADDAARRRAERAARAEEHVEARRREDEREAAKAQLLVDRFVARAKQDRLATEELTARPWSGNGRYRTGVVGWYIRNDHSLGIGEDGGYYVLVVPPVRFGRWRGVRLDPSPPPLVVGRGARDGETVDLAALLDLRLRWPEGDGQSGRDESQG
jgi:hypothetical protein